MISIIIPVHNGIRTLDRAVRSVLRQTVRGREELEILLVDDGSLQETADRCDQLAGEYPGDQADSEDSPDSGKEDMLPAVVHVLHMDDRGVSAARNLGLMHAQGSLITFLDDDDAMDPSMLEILLQMQEETGSDFSGCSFRSVSPAADVGQENSSGIAPGDSEKSMEQLTAGSDSWEDTPEDMAIFHGEEIITKRILQRDTRVWSKLFTRDLIDRADGAFLEGLTIGEDMLFVLSLLRPDTRYAVTEEPLYLYTVNPAGAMERPFTESYMDQLRCWDEAEKVIREHFPSVLQNEDAAAQFGSLRIVSDILTASKIAKLPSGEWGRYQEEFGICRSSLAAHRKTPGAMKRIPRDYRVKAELLSRFPGIYRRLYQPKDP